MDSLHLKGHQQKNVRDQKERKCTKRRYKDTILLFEVLKRVGPHVSKKYRGRIMEDLITPTLVSVYLKVPIYGNIKGNIDTGWKQQKM